MAKTTRGKNLFAIDHAAIESTLNEANQALLKDRDKLLRAFESLPATLDTVEEIEKSQQFARDVEQALSEAKKARLADGRPFSDASKIVKDFFLRIEGPLKATLDELQERVTRAALNRQREDITTSLDDEDEDVEEPTSVIRSRTGAPAIALASDKPAKLSLEWVVEGFDRDRLDLEKLRPYLTDSALLAACRKHLEVNGPHKLPGASYEQVAQL
jgi:hypothetical protein